jgi:GDP-4-dehydro-6-deoxy-D-mannose reductase
MGHLRDEGDEVIELAEGVDLCDLRALQSDLRGAEFDVCYHLAALSHVGASWTYPDRYFHNNVVGTANLVSVLAALDRTSRLLHVSSSEVYGQVSVEDSPILETRPLRPVSPYAASKAASEVAAMQGWYGRGLPVVVARPFNHTGPRQSTDFLVPALASRLMAAKREGRASLQVGNIQARRDFMDVRDVARAYRLLAVHGEPGEVYNVCSGDDVSVNEILDLLCESVGYGVTFEVDTRLLRPNDVEVVQGSPRRLVAATGFRREFELRQTIEAIVMDLSSGSRRNPGD